jgi:eukaryotic-like serine/threonine-protein kinase
MSLNPFNKRQTLPVLSEDSTLITIPKKIGPYQIKSLFNKGGMSLLYLATKEGSNEPIVIKVLPPKYAKDKEMVNRFLKEAEIISIFNHPNIIRLYGQGTWEKGLYIATEFIQGISLRQFIQNQVFSTKKALEIILQIAYALCHLHSHKIIHRDLKPENILITASGEIKVIDFGIAQLKAESIPSPNKIKQIIGTPVYMSPEQKEDPTNVSFQTDIYSLGVITYELVLGRLSHGSIELSRLPKRLQTIVGKALKGDLSRRYQDVVEFMTDIGEYLKKLNDKNSCEDESRDEIINFLNQANELLLPKDLNVSSNLEIFFQEKKGALNCGIYLDYFLLPKNRHLFILAEPVKEGIKTINYAAILRGMVKSEVYHFCSKENIDGQLSTFVLSLNEILLKDTINHIFALSLLFLNEEKNQLRFSSLGHQHLFSINEERKKITLISSPNPFLGEKLLSITEGVGSWNSKDRLILLSLAANKKQNLPPLKKIISDNIIFPPELTNRIILEKLEEGEENFHIDYQPKKKEEKNDSLGKIEGSKKRTVIVTIKRKN